MKDIQQGISLRRAKKLAKKMGIRVELVRRTGEVRFTHPEYPPVTHNNREDVASRVLVSLMRKVQRDLRAANDNAAFERASDEDAA